MLSGISVKENEVFVSKHDTSEPKTEFILRPLSGVEMLDLTSIMKDGEVELNSKGVMKLLTSSVQGVTNFKNGAGEDETDVQKILSNLSLPVITELLEKVTSLNSITEQETKN